MSQHWFHTYIERNPRFPQRLLAVVFLLVGSWIFWFAQHEYRFAKQSPAWPVTEGTVEESKVVVKTSGGRRGTTSVFWEFEYTYFVDGEIYFAKGNTLRFGKIFYGRDESYDFKKRFPKGKTLNVYYNPKKPSQSILEPGFNKSLERFMWYGIPLGFFLFIGGFIALCSPADGDWKPKGKLSHEWEDWKRAKDVNLK